MWYLFEYNNLIIKIFSMCACINDQCVIGNVIKPVVPIKGNNKVWNTEKKGYLHDAFSLPIYVSEIAKSIYVAYTWTIIKWML